MDNPQYGFALYRNVSYSFQLQRADRPETLTTQAHASDKVIMADRSPLFKFDGVTANNYSNMVVYATKPLGANSTNHQDKGQNVLRLDGSCVLGENRQLRHRGRSPGPAKNANGKAVTPSPADAADRPFDMDDTFVGP